MLKRNRIRQAEYNDTALSNEKENKLMEEMLMWRDKALTHACAREKLEKDIREENARYIERDIQVEELKEILEYSENPKSDYLKWKVAKGIES
jgi:hypothetical protein